MIQSLQMLDLTLWSWFSIFVLLAGEQILLMFHDVGFVVLPLV